MNEKTKLNVFRGVAMALLLCSIFVEPKFLSIALRFSGLGMIIALFNKKEAITFSENSLSKNLIVICFIFLLCFGISFII